MSSQADVRPKGRVASLDTTEQDRQFKIIYPLVRSQIRILGEDTVAAVVRTVKFLLGMNSGDMVLLFCTRVKALCTVDVVACEMRELGMLLPDMAL